MSHKVDPFDAATEAGERSYENVYFGQVKIKPEFVVLQKGVGMVPYSESKHDANDRRTNVRMMLQPLRESGLQYTVERNVLAESRTWAKITWASARKLGLNNARDLDGTWVQAKLAETGRTWESNGETKKETTLEFVEIYADREACVAAYQERFGENGDGAENAGTNGKVHSPNGDAEKATALEFAKVLVGQYGEDKDALAKAMAEMPMIAKHFTIESPEIQQLLAA